MRFIIAAIAASTFASLSTGCFVPFLGGCDDGASIVDTSPAEIASPIVVARDVSACAVPSPFTGGFELDVESAPPTAIFTVSIARSIAIGEVIPLRVGDPASASDAQIADTEAVDVRLDYTPNGAAPDGTPIAAALVTVSAIPSVDGEPLEVTLEIHFLDGRVLEQTFSAPVVGGTECPLS